MENKEYKNRESNIELLRIISMIFIICHHWGVHGIGNFHKMDISFNKIFIEIFSYGGKLGVDLYVLISGYFLINSDFKIRKLLKLILDTSFFSIIILTIYIFLGNSISFINIIRSLFPIFYNLWWFISTYFAMYLFSYFINTFILSFNQVKLDILLTLLIFILSIFPTLFRINLASSKLAWFITLYILGARIRLYPLINKRLDRSILIGIILYSFCILSVFLLNYISIYVSDFKNYTTYFSRMDSPLILFCSLFFFIGFSKLKIKNNIFINKISSTTLGIYLIHDNEYLRNIIWQDILKTKLFIDSELLMLHALLSVLFVFVACSFISLFYNNTLGKITKTVSLYGEIIIIQFSKKIKDLYLGTIKSE